MRSDRRAGAERETTAGAFAPLWTPAGVGCWGWDGDVRFPAETRGGAPLHPHGFRARLDSAAALDVGLVALRGAIDAEIVASRAADRVQAVVVASLTWQATALHDC